MSKKIKIKEKDYMFEPLDEEEAEYMAITESDDYVPIQTNPEELEKEKERYASYARNTIKEREKQKKKNKQKTIYVQVGTKKFPLVITYIGKKYEEDEIVHIKCDGAKINQEYLKKDLPSLLQDMEELILMEQKKH